MEIRLTEKVIPDQSEVEKLSKIFNCNCEHCYGRQEAIAKLFIREKAIAVLEAVIKELDEYGENTGNVCRIISHYQSRLAELRKDAR